MKKWLAVSALLALILVMLKIVSAESSTLNSNSQSSQKQKNRGKYGKISGMVDLIENNVVKVRTAKGVIKQFHLTSETQVQKNGANVTAVQIHAGDHLKLLRYEKATNNILRIEIGS